MYWGELGRGGIEETARGKSIINYYYYKSIGELSKKKKSIYFWWHLTVS